MSAPREKEGGEGHKHTVTGRSWMRFSALFLNFHIFPTGPRKHQNVFRQLSEWNNIVPCQMYCINNTVSTPQINRVGSRVSVGWDQNKNEKRVKGKTSSHSFNIIIKGSWRLPGQQNHLLFSCWCRGTMRIFMRVCPNGTSSTYNSFRWCLGFPLFHNWMLTPIFVFFVISISLWSLQKFLKY